MKKLQNTFFILGILFVFPPLLITTAHLLDRGFGIFKMQAPLTELLGFSNFPSYACGIQRNDSYTSMLACVSNNYMLLNLGLHEAETFLTLALVLMSLAVGIKMKTSALSRKRKILASLILPFILLVFRTYYIHESTKNFGPQSDPPSDLCEMCIISIADFTKDDILMGASHNVFVGRVIKQSGEKALGVAPETQFQVEVIENIKGDLKGTVTVNQLGGYQNGVLVTVEQEGNGTNSDPYMLEPGQTYLLATRYNEGEDWHTLNSFPTARKLLSKDPNANIADLKTLAQNDERVKVLIAAYPNEKLLDADIQHQNTRNNYKDYEVKREAEQIAPTKTNTSQIEKQPVSVN